MVLATEPKTAAVEGLLRRLGVAIKAVALYPPPHPVADRAIAEFHERLQSYAQAHGPFVARVTKKNLTVDGAVFGEGVHQTLAFVLYTRRLASLAIMPMVGVEELSAFIAVVGRDRRSLDAAGGVTHLLWQAGVENVQVVEVSVKSDTLIPGGSQASEAPPVIDIRSRLSPQERERIINTLRAGPEEAGRLLETLSGVSGDAEEPEGQAERVYLTLQHLDRLILDQPPEEQSDLTARLADASMHLAEPVRTELDRTLLTRAGEDVTADLLIGHFSSERLAHAVLSAIAQDRAVEQIATLLIGARISREKAQAVLAILDERLRPPGEQPQWLFRNVWPLVQANQQPQPEATMVWDGEFDDEQAGIDELALASRIEEGRAATDDGVTREIIRTLVDVLLAEDDLHELTDTVALLEEHLPWVTEHNEFALLGEVLKGVRVLAVSPSESHREIAARIKQTLTADRVVDRLIALLWEGRGTSIEQEIQTCLTLAADTMIGPLVRLLEREPMAGKRLMICDVLTAVGRPHIDELARSLGDPSPDLVADIASVLGRLGHPDAVPHLARVRRHPGYRVRREVTDALARIGTDDAQALLAGCLDDPDPRILVRVLGALNGVGLRIASSRIRQLLGYRDWLNRQFELRQAALISVERFGGADFLPVVGRLARQRFCFGPRAQEIRRLASQTEVAISARQAESPSSPLGTGEDDRR